MAKLNFSIVLLVALSCANVTVADETTTPPSSTTLGPETTTTSQPNTTTTEAPPTTSTTTSTTTEKPTTTGTPASTTTPKPEPPVHFPLNTGSWSFTSSDNITCIRVAGAFELYFPYNATGPVNGTTTIKNGTVDVPKDAFTVDGHCGKKLQVITLTWTPIGITDRAENNTLTFAFATHDGNDSKISDGKFALDHIEYEVQLSNKEHFPNATDTSLKFKIDALDKDQVAVSKSYKCFAERTIKNSDHEAQLKVANSQFQAFRNSTDNAWGPSEECNLDGVTDIVPIAVGASLAGLVVIVLIAYLIGRRRSRARGYQSV
jgi:lysosomal-associated membrane protein 1/2